MYLLSENTQKTFEFPNKSHVIVGRNTSCDIQIEDDEIAEKHFSIIQEPFGLILEVFDQPLYVNKIPCKERCLLFSGDHISIGTSVLIVIDENKIPKEAKPYNQKQQKKQEGILASVYGLRCYSGKSNGEFIIPTDNLQLHNFNLIDKKNLELKCHSNSTLRLNGHSVSCSRISNGDIISSDQYKYVVEFPGSSGFSKFSPSHPRNVLLSEKIDHHQTSSTPSPPSSFWEKHAWWLAILVGITGIICLLVVQISNKT